MDIEKAYQNFFSRYGSPSKSSDQKIHIWLTHPDSLDKLKDVEYHDKHAAQYIQDLENYIEILKVYRQNLCKRYNELATAATVPGIKLVRERNYYEKKVRYRITWYTHYIDANKDVETEYKLFNGTERHAAIKEFKEYVKSHPDIISSMNIEKSKWER